MMGKASKLKMVLQSIGCLIIFIIILECANRMVFYFRYTNPKATHEKRLDLSVYKNVDWAEEYFKENRKAGSTYESYLGWKGEAFKGKFINVSSEGVRKTWNPPNLEKSKAKLVYCFGGSVLWGSGSRDDYTVPSYISKLLNKDKEQYYVINYGQSGYSFFQEMISLLLLIRDHQVPDYVIFFDGINDIHSAFVNNRAGEAADWAAKREQLKYEGEIKSNRDYLKKFIRGYIDARINAYTFTRVLRNQWRESRETDEEEKVRNMSVYSRDEQQLLSLANEVVDDYFSTADIVRRLSDTYGFKVAFFWQPMTGAHTASSEEEVGFTEAIGGTRLDFSRLVYKLVEEKENQKDFYDLQKIFQSKDKNVTVFVDFAHLSELGNSMVAEEIVNILKAKPGWLESRTQHDSNGPVIKKF